MTKYVLIRQFSFIVKFKDLQILLVFLDGYIIHLKKDLFLLKMWAK